MNKSPDSKKSVKRNRKKTGKTARSSEQAKIQKQEGTGIGGVQLGTQGDEKKLSKGKRTSRKVRDLG